jgi:hypothetical protein
MSALRKTLMLIWILMLGVVVALRYFVFSKFPSAIERSATAARGEMGIN